MEDRRAFLIDGCWKLDGVEDQHATRVVQAIRSRRYVNQKEIAEGARDRSTPGVGGAHPGSGIRHDQRGGVEEVPGGGEGVTEGDGGPVRRGGQPGLLTPLMEWRGAVRLLF